MERDAKNIYFVFAEKEVKVCAEPEVKEGWEKFQRNVTTVLRRTHQVFFPRTCRAKQEDYDGRTWALQRSIQKFQKAVSLH